jgi:hypothetical protein
MAVSNASKASILDEKFGSGATNIAPATWHLALSTTVPLADGTGITEPVGGAYARVAVTNNGTNFGPATTSPAQLTTNTAITWPEATADWGTIVAVVLMDAASGGVMHDFQELTVSQVVNARNTAEIPAMNGIWS